VIRSLEIHGLVVIERAELEFGSGLSVFTGETGAGKTVLTNAIGLLGGAPADAAVVRPGHRQALVQAEFQVPAGFWEDLDEDDPAATLRELVDDTEQFTVTRRIPADGRSRSLVDGTVAPRAAVGALVGHLVRFSGQGDQRTLTAPRAQLAALDRFCGPDATARSAELARLQREIRARARAHGRAAADRQVLMRRREELAELVAAVDALAPLEGEYAQLLAERERVRHADRLVRAAALAAEAIAPADRDAGARELVGQAQHAVGEVVDLDPLLAPAAELLGEAQALIGEAAVQLRGYLDGLDAEPGRLDVLEGRLEQFARLARRADTDPEGIGSWADAARGELAVIAAADEGQERYATEQAALVDRAAGLADELRALRVAGAPALADALRAALVELAMPEARVRIEVTGAEDPLDSDTATIFVQPNAGLAEAPLGDVASGGELSRVLLALHGLSAGADAATWVFDEIDAGIGGVTATAVAARLAALGRVTQTLAITHLAQVAAAAQAQFVLDKGVTDDGVARTEIVEVTGDARIAELCRMLGARDDDPGARQHVTKLLRDAPRGLDGAALPS
jgi:DNA repair protein RecN (Recombination protein N)